MSRCVIAKRYMGEDHPNQARSLHVQDQLTAAEGVAAAPGVPGIHLLPEELSQSCNRPVNSCQKVHLLAEVQVCEIDDDSILMQ